MGGCVAHLLKWESLYCSTQHGQGRPIGIGFETLAELGHHTHKVWPKSLWFYRCMLRTHGQLKTVLPQDRSAKLQGKMKIVLASLVRGENTFVPDRSWDALLVRLFPEVACLWAAEPGQVAKTALTKTQQDVRVEETPSWKTTHR